MAEVKAFACVSKLSAYVLDVAWLADDGVVGIVMGPVKNEDPETYRFSPTEAPPPTTRAPVPPPVDDVVEVMDTVPALVRPVRVPNVVTCGREALTENVFVVLVSPVPGRATRPSTYVLVAAWEPWVGVGTVMLPEKDAVPVTLMDDKVPT